MERCEVPVAGSDSADATVGESTVVQAGRTKAPADAAATVRNCRRDGLFSRDVCVKASLAIGVGVHRFAWKRMCKASYDPGMDAEFARVSSSRYRVPCRRVRLFDRSGRWDDDGDGCRREIFRAVLDRKRALSQDVLRSPNGESVTLIVALGRGVSRWLRCAVTSVWLIEAPAADGRVIQKRDHLDRLLPCGRRRRNHMQSDYNGDEDGDDGSEHLPHSSGECGSASAASGRLIGTDVRDVRLASALSPFRSRSFRNVGCMPPSL